MSTACPLSANFMSDTESWKLDAADLSQRMRVMQQATTDFNKIVYRTYCDNFGGITSTYNNIFELMLNAREPQAALAVPAEIWRCWVEAARENNGRFRDVLAAWRVCGTTILNGVPSPVSTEDEAPPVPESAAAERPRRAAVGEA